MKALLAILLVALAPLSLGPAAARNYHHHPRNPEVPRAFQRQNPCPSTGRTYGGCPGYIRDHIRPLCAGGPDHPSNMQWQTREASFEKDRWERRICRRRR